MLKFTCADLFNYNTPTDFHFKINPSCASECCVTMRRAAVHNCLLTSFNPYAMYVLPIISIYSNAEWGFQNNGAEKPWWSPTIRDFVLWLCAFVLFFVLFCSPSVSSQLRLVCLRSIALCMQTQKSHYSGSPPLLTPSSDPLTSACPLTECMTQWAG